MASIIIVYLHNLSLRAVVSFPLFSSIVPVGTGFRSGKTPIAFRLVSQCYLFLQYRWPLPRQSILPAGIFLTSHDHVLSCLD